MYFLANAVVYMLSLIMPKLTWSLTAAQQPPAGYTLVGTTGLVQVAYCKLLVTFAALGQSKSLIKVYWAASGG